MGLIVTGKNELGLHDMIGEVDVQGTHQIMTVVELNSARDKTQLEYTTKLPHKKTWAWHCRPISTYDEPVLVLTKAQQIVNFEKSSEYYPHRLQSIVSNLRESLTHELRLQLAYCSNPMTSSRSKAQELVMRTGLRTCNGLYVAVSGLGSKSLGLFTGRRFESGEQATTYSGEFSQDVGGAKRSHARNVRGGFVLDGTDWAEYFRTGLTAGDFEAQAKLPASERAHYMPNSGSAAMDFLLSHTGVGYMANTGDKCNVTIDYVTHHVKHASVAYHDVCTLKFNKAVERDEEIICMYAFKAAKSRMNHFEDDKKS